MPLRYSMRLMLREHGVPGGVETLNIQLIRELTELVECVVWVMPRRRFEYFQQFLPASDRLIYQSDYWPGKAWLPHNLEKAVRFAIRQKNTPARFAFENLRWMLSDLRLRQIIRDYNLSHCLCNWTLHIAPPRLGVPIGLILADLRWKRFPETFPGSCTEKIERQFCNWLTRASAVFPVSEETASDLKRFYPWYSRVMHVIPHGARSARHNGTPPAAVSDMPPKVPLFYYPAGAEDHKNHLILFEACAKLFAKGNDFEVVLTGAGTEHFNGTYPSDGPRSIELCRALLQREKALFRGRIKPRGYCAHAEVESLYKRCTAVVLPSFFEGFGLPLIEALQNGAEIICSDIPAYREQLARYGCAHEVWLTPASDATALATEMEKVLAACRQPRWRKRVPSNALERWTWKDAAAAYVEALSALPSTERAF